MGRTIYRECRYQLSGKEAWPFAIVNHKRCGEVLFQFIDLHDVDDFQNLMMSSLSIDRPTSLETFS